MQQDLSFADAIDLLKKVVIDYGTSGRRTLAAGVKAEMQRRGPGGFDERGLGFETFREFLLQAERAGAVVLEREGPHTAIYLAGRASNTADQLVGSKRRPRVRPDLWSAFTDWKADWVRAWDKTEREAIMLPPQEATGRARPAHDAIRQALSQTPDRFVRIDPISRETQLKWMREFAEQQDDRQAQLLLEFGLTTERPTQSFSQLARTQPGLYAAWLDTRTARVIDEVEAWRASNALTIDITAQRQDVQAPRVSEAVADAGLARSSDEQLRALAHKAIDRMSPAELGRLAIPLEYLAG